MPPPPLPSRDDDEHGAMPADCRVETLRAWLATNECVDHADMARTVRALVEAKVREAALATEDVFHPDCGPLTDKSAAFIATRVLGAP